MNNNWKIIRVFCNLFFFFIIFSNISFGETSTVKLLEKRNIEVTYKGISQQFEIDLPTWKNVKEELYEQLPVFDPNAALWRKGAVLEGVKACECAVFNALDSKSVQVHSLQGKVYIRGKDYEFEDTTGAIGRLEGGNINSNTKVLISYRCIESRIDSIVFSTDDKLVLLSGKPRILSPEPPILSDGQKRLVNLYVTGLTSDLTDASIFPIDEAFAYEKNLLNAREFIDNLDSFKNTINTPELPAVSQVGAVKKYLPKIWNKLMEGKEVRILAWGDSVTACGFLPDEDRWQVKFANGLQKMFPNAKITLMTEAWGGRNSDSYRSEPSGSPKNYKEKVLDLKPDLIISEFVNDSYMDESVVVQKYGEMLADFKKYGIEWIILGPHYVRPDWMGFQSEKNIDDDPRPYVKGIRKFAIQNDVPLADASELYGKLWRSGIPYLTLMTNNINHPNDFGMELFASSLLHLFK